MARPRNPDKKVQFAVRLTAADLERLRAAVYWLEAEGVTIQGLAETSILKALEGLERKYHGGKPFPPPDAAKQLLK